MASLRTVARSGALVYHHFPGGNQTTLEFSTGAAFPAG
jgi:hypothetical protein